MLNWIRLIGQSSLRATGRWWRLAVGVECQNDIPTAGGDHGAAARCIRLEISEPSSASHGDEYSKRPWACQLDLDAWARIEPVLNGRITHGTRTDSLATDHDAANLGHDGR
ncbi:hypothetical protein [Herpetosiphon llansteffanensis]|uniref:hypothetical protein n=1 Tax=Herpetosiphon llansteffanensis TaxID=2094568 RepID=UPI0013DF7E38|nr:hypothetical protein [Herpetosiphon llansteffanensis]